MAGADSTPPDPGPSVLPALLNAAGALHGAPSLDAALDALARAAVTLDPGRVTAAQVYVQELAGLGAAPAAGGAFSLRAAAPADGPGVEDLPAAALAAADEAEAPRCWPDAALPGGPAWWLLPLATGATSAVLALWAVEPLDPAALGPWLLLARLGGQAVELAWLRHEAGRGDVEIGLLDRVSDVVNSSLRLDEILTQVLAHLSAVIPFDGGSIALVNNADELEIRAIHGAMDDAARRVRVPVGEGISGWVAANNQPYLSNDLDAEQAVRPVMRSTGSNRRFGAYLAAPLTVEGRVIGILQVNSTRKQVYRGRDLALLAEVAERCALAVDRARLFGEMQARANRLASLNEIARRISAALDPDALFRTCYEQVRRVMPADAFLVALYDSEAGLVRYEFLIDGEDQCPKSSMPLDSGLTSYVIRTRQPLLIGDRAELPRAPLPFGTTQRLSEALMMVPLIFEGRVLGAMSAQAYAPRAYTPADLSLLMTIGNQAAVAIRNAQLYQSEREAQQARDEFLSLVSHELRTPLTAIKGAAQVIQRRVVRAFSAGEVQSPEEQERRGQDVRQLAVIVDQADRLNALVNDLLDLSRLQSHRFEFHPETADLAALVRLVAEASRALSTTHQVIVQAPARLPGIFDPLRIEQVLTNLISNAIKYSPAETAVQVMLDAPEPDLARVQVHDEGPGLDPTEQAHLFERFFRGSAVRHDPRTGLGLGLFISQQIVAWHGGQITVESGPGAGSTFTFTLPLAGPPPAAEL